METHPNCHPPRWADLDNRVLVLVMTGQGKQFAAVSDGAATANEWEVNTFEGREERKEGGRGREDERLSSISPTSLSAETRSFLCLVALLLRLAATLIISEAAAAAAFLQLVNPRVLDSWPDSRVIRMDLLSLFFAPCNSCLFKRERTPPNYLITELSVPERWDSE